MKKKKAKDIRVSARIPAPLKERIQKVATHMGVDVSDVVRIALKDGLSALEEGRKPAANQQS